VSERAWGFKSPLAHTVTDSRSGLPGREFVVSGLGELRTW
jgi:hypothetical protein